MFTYTCQICGEEFQSASNRAKYCVYCRDKAQVLRNKAYKKKKEAGTSITVGSEQICPICGNPYTVTSGSQKCCKNCQKKQTNARKAVTNSRYTKANYDPIIFYVPKGQREEIKAYARSQGLSVNKLILTALEEYGRRKKMDNKYWENRCNGCYLNNEHKERFVKENSPFCESKFNEFVSNNKFLIPEIYINFLRKYNGLEVDKKLKYKNSSGAEITTLVPIVLPFNQALPYFKRLQEHKKTKSKFFPVALTPSEFRIYLLKVKGINKGKVYLFDGIMNDVFKEFNSINEFFEILEIDI